MHSKEHFAERQLKWSRHPEGQTDERFEKAESIFEGFVSNMEKHLNCTREPFNIDELWRNTLPDSMDPDIVKATGQIYQKLVYRATAKDVVDPFIAQHKAVCDGRVPYLEPIFRLRYQYGSSVTVADFETAVKDFYTYKNWLNDVLLECESDEVPILVFPQTWGMPNY